MITLYKTIYHITNWQWRRVVFYFELISGNIERNEHLSKILEILSKASHTKSQIIDLNWMTGNDQASHTTTGLAVFTSYKQLKSPFLLFQDTLSFKITLHIFCCDRMWKELSFNYRKSGKESFKLEQAERIDLLGTIFYSTLDKHKFRPGCVTYYNAGRKVKDILKETLDIRNKEVATYQQMVFGSSKLFYSMIHHLWGKSRQIISVLNWTTARAKLSQTKTLTISAKTQKRSHEIKKFLMRGIQGKT